MARDIPKLQPTRSNSKYMALNGISAAIVHASRLYIYSNVLPGIDALDSSQNETVGATRAATTGLPPTPPALVMQIFLRMCCPSNGHLQIVERCICVLDIIIGRCSKRTSWSWPRLGRISFQKPHLPSASRPKPTLRTRHRRSEETVDMLSVTLPIRAPAVPAECRGGMTGPDPGTWAPVVPPK